MVHALWIEWRQTVRQTAAVMAFAGVKNAEPDAHTEFDDLYGPPRTAPRRPLDREERMRIVAALAR